MNFDDFLHNFEKLEICNLGPDVMEEVYEMTGIRPIAQLWSTNTHDGAWIRGSSAGGCRNYIESFPTNPQFVVHLEDADPDDDDDLCTIIFAVLQKYRREMKHQGLSNLPIGFSIFQIDDNFDGRLDRRFFQSNKSACRSPSFINLREITGRFRVPPGSYMIVPSTFEPNQEAEFMLRIFSNGNIQSDEL